MSGIAMGMNELGPRRCPFVFVSVILEKKRYREGK